MREFVVVHANEPNFASKYFVNITAPRDVDVLQIVLRKTFEQ